MTRSPAVVFQALALKEGQDQQPPAALVEDIKKQDGFQRAFFGRKMEDPDTGVLCTEWSSSDAALRYRSSQQQQQQQSLLGDVKETLVIALSPSPSQGPVFDAPCTEIFTAFGAEEGFAGNVGRFVRAVDGAPPVGYRGAVFGESVGDGERIVRLAIGWESREAHLEAKGRPGAIQDHIHELRTGRRAVDLFHVELKEL